MGSGTQGERFEIQVGCRGRGGAPAGPGAPFFFRQWIGKNGRSFRMVKLRTTDADAEQRRADLRALNEMPGSR